MDWEHVEGRWHQLTGKVAAQWGRLTDDDIRTVEGKKDVLIRLLQKRYGLRRGQAVHEVEAWVQKLDLPLVMPKDHVGQGQMAV